MDVEAKVTDMKRKAEALAREAHRQQTGESAPESNSSSVEEE